MADLGFQPSFPWPCGLCCPHSDPPQPLVSEYQKPLWLKLFISVTLSGPCKQAMPPCQLFLTSECLTPPPKLRQELQAHLTPDTPHPFFVSTSFHFFICDLSVDSLLPHYPSASFIRVLLTQIGLWSYVNMDLSQRALSPLEQLYPFIDANSSLLLCFPDLDQYYLPALRHSFCLWISSLQQKYPE